MWWVVPFKSKKSLGTESRMDIEDILKMKLETIKEEPEINEENGAITKHRSISKKVKKIHLKVKMRKLFISQLSLKESYVIFMTGFSSKGGLSGLPRY
ncbi:hypothetical protein BUALT_Bualt15G0103700 [Buddleja alternifolia]|uniref:Uncharacterized protein n=1 Tax=Buddleja alternifolia TaxID=168488 RepID=A0AAV6WJD8_9LAMI|nr:hypothetical protein BUALT_Bualt15G0103700 [Buddleja alternifolia]